MFITLIIYPHRGALSPLDMSFGEHVLSLLLITITNYLLINYYVMNIYLYVFMFITFLVCDQAVRAMEKDPSEGPQYMTGVLGLGPSSKSLDVVQGILAWFLD
jgi:hypothetical protein